jgi:hypothetical protein
MKIYIASGGQGALFERVFQGVFSQKPYIEELSRKFAQNL